MRRRCCHRSRRRLRSTSSSALVVPTTRRTMIGDRAFGCRCGTSCMEQSSSITASTSSGTVRKYLKTYLFSLSFYSTGQQPTESIKHPCSSFPLLRRSIIVSFTFHHNAAKSVVSYYTYVTLRYVAALVEIKNVRSTQHCDVCAPSSRSDLRVTDRQTDGQTVAASSAIVYFAAWTTVQ